MTNNINWNVSGTSHFLIPSSDGLLTKLAPAIYEVNYEQNRGFYLVRKYDSYPLPSDIYNFNNSNVKSDLAELFYNRFTASTDNLGVLLIGEKGTGKSLLMKRTANLAIANGLPVITVENSYNSESLAKFLSSIKDDAVVLFDEFEKKYDSDEDADNRPSQAGLLSFFDGTSVYRKLIIVTANNRYGINEFFLNRPSRIRYVIDYKGLTYEFVKEYLEQHLIHPQAVQPLLDELDLVPAVNFDLLHNVVEEVNLLYPTESVKAIMSIANIKRDDTSIMTYTMTVATEDGSIQLTNDFTTFEWDDVEFNGFDGVHIGIEAEKSMKDNPNVTSFLPHFFVHAKNITQLKGRNHFTAKVELNINGGKVPATAEFKRIKVNYDF